MPCGSLVGHQLTTPHWKRWRFSYCLDMWRIVVGSKGQEEWANLNENVNYHHWWWHNTTQTKIMRSWMHGGGGGMHGVWEENPWLWYFSIRLVVTSRKLVDHSTYFNLLYCFTDINDCLGVSCSGNGNCSDRVDGYICFCNSGFFGINCEVGKASHLIQ